MVSPPCARELLGDRAVHAAKIGEDFADLRGVHLDRLASVEALVRSAAPLPISYDVTRTQPPFFNEFTYTEALGCLYVAPQSCEVAARLAALGAEVGGGFDVAGAVMDRHGSLDKYVLDPADRLSKSVFFGPGSNIFKQAVSRDGLSRAMHDDPDLIIKPHPMTNEGWAHELGREYGYHRVAEPMASGDAYLRGADRVYVTSATEMGLYAVLLGKEVRNLGVFGWEARGVYNPFYRLVWGLGREEARAILIRALNSPVSGLFHPDDPGLEERISRYFDAAMAAREVFRPLVSERWT